MAHFVDIELEKEARLPIWKRIILLKSFNIFHYRQFHSVCFFQRSVVDENERCLTNLVGASVSKELLKDANDDAGAPVARNRVEQIFSNDDIQLLEAMGILFEREDLLWGGVDLFCSGGLLFVTDHRYMIREEDRLDEDPVMYIGMDSHGLVQTAPRQACNRVLDLCCGSGIQDGTLPGGRKRQCLL